MANFKPAKLERYNAEPLGNILGLFVAKNNLTDGLVRKAVFDAWNEASSAAQYTADLFYRDEILYVKVRSSVLRSQLMFQSDVIRGAMNTILKNNEVLNMCGIPVEVKEIKLH